MDDVAFDLRLYAEAARVHWTEWERVGDLEKKARTAKGRLALHRLKMRLYHEEEANSDMI